MVRPAGEIEPIYSLRRLPLRTTTLLHHHLILGTTWTGLGALLIVVGAVMVLGDIAAAIGMTYGETRPQPRTRLAVAVSRVGAFSAAVGAVILAAVAGVSAEAVLVVLVVVATLVYVSMAHHLKKHLDLVARESNGERPSWGWCLRHPVWRPPD
jgi:hypothetical protein